MSVSAARILDEYLVAAARTGDRKAFALLAQRWHGKLVAHAWRLTGDRESAMDAAQAGWLEIVRGLGRLQDERAFAAWAYRIVSRRCARQVSDAVRAVIELAERQAAVAADEETPPSGGGGLGGEPGLGMRVVPGNGLRCQRPTPHQT